MAMTTYPLNNVQYNAEDAELYNAVRISGVWSGSSFDADVTGNDTIVTIGEGLAWIANTKFSGKVVASKEPTELNLGTADPSYNRIDVIAIQFDSVENKTDIVIKKGIATSSPEMPERSTTESLYELYLYSVLRTAGSSVISKSNITDLRDNREHCGYMQDSVKPGYAPSLMEHNKGDDFRFWVGTKAEYDTQKGNLKENTFCIVTDENDIETYSVSNNEEIDKVINEVYSDMSNNSIRNIILNETTNATILGGGISNCTIYKTTEAYGFLEVGRYSTGGIDTPAIKYIRSRNSSKWGKWDKENRNFLVSSLGEHNEASLKIKLDEQLMDMYIGESRQVRFKLTQTGSVVIGNYTWSGFLKKEAEGYATIEAISGYANNATKIFDYRDNTGWHIFAFDNPPMIPNVEYRTTKRHNGRAVYVKRVIVQTAATILKTLASGVDDIVATKMNYIKIGTAYVIYDSADTIASVNVRASITSDGDLKLLGSMFADDAEISVDIEYTKN